MAKKPLVSKKNKKSGYAVGGDITERQRSTGEADFTVYDYNGRSYSTRAAAEKARQRDLSGEMVRAGQDTRPAQRVTEDTSRMTMNGERMPTRPDTAPAPGSVDSGRGYDPLDETFGINPADLPSRTTPLSEGPLGVGSGGRVVGQNSQRNTTGSTPGITQTTGAKGRYYGKLYQYKNKTYINRADAERARNRDLAILRERGGGVDTGTNTGANTSGVNTSNQTSKSKSTLDKQTQEVFPENLGYPKDITVRSLDSFDTEAASKAIDRAENMRGTFSENLSLDQATDIALDMLAQAEAENMSKEDTVMSQDVLGNQKSYSPSNVDVQGWSDSKSGKPSVTSTDISLAVDMVEEAVNSGTMTDSRANTISEVTGVPVSEVQSIADAVGRSAQGQPASTPTAQTTFSGITNNPAITGRMSAAQKGFGTYDKGEYGGTPSVPGDQYGGYGGLAGDYGGGYGGPSGNFGGGDPSAPGGSAGAGPSFGGGPGGEFGGATGPTGGDFGSGSDSNNDGFGDMGGIYGGYSKGGTAMSLDQQMRLFEEGGIADDGMRRDPVSGNEIPAGSMAKEVRDDIPAQLSEGEYVVPADVVRYYGVRFFEDLRSEAKMGLQQMEQDGRIGGEPVPPGGPRGGSGMGMDSGILTEEEMAALDQLGLAVGGYIPPQSMANMQQAPQAMGNMNYMQQPMYQGYEDGGDVSREDIITESYTGEQLSGAYPLGYSLFNGSSSSSGSATQQTVILYGPNNEVISLSLPTDQARYDDLISQGYTTEPKVTVGPTEEETQENIEDNYGGLADNPDGPIGQDLGNMSTEAINDALEGLQSGDSFQSKALDVLGKSILGKAITALTGKTPKDKAIEDYKAELSRRGEDTGKKGTPTPSPSTPSATPSSGEPFSGEPLGPTPAQEAQAEQESQIGLDAFGGEGPSIGGDTDAPGPDAPGPDAPGPSGGNASPDPGLAGAEVGSGEDGADATGPFNKGGFVTRRNKKRK